MRSMWVAVLLIATAGCYHATIETGLAPSAQTVSKEWAAGWIYGLVPPSTVETAAKCPHGVAKVETQLSFPNMLVGWLTLDIYTPMSIVVTCAQTGATADAATHPAMTVTQSQGDAAVRAAFKTAAEQAAKTKAPVLVQVEDGL
jgi:Bor protein